MSDNWVVQNLQNPLSTCNEKLTEVWSLLTESPENFKDGAIWNVISKNMIVEGKRRLLNNHS